MALTPVEQVRLLVGDIADEFFILSDEDYEFFLEQEDGNVKRAAIAAAPSILFALSSKPVRERTGDIEVWQNWASEYRKALELFIKNPLTQMRTLIPYASGISVSDMCANNANPDNVKRKLPPKTGCSYLSGCGCSSCTSNTFGEGCG